MQRDIHGSYPLLAGIAKKKKKLWPCGIPDRMINLLWCELNTVEATEGARDPASSRVLKRKHTQRSQRLQRLALGRQKLSDKLGRQPRKTRWLTGCRLVELTTGSTWSAKQLLSFSPPSPLPVPRPAFFMHGVCVDTKDKEQVLLSFSSCRSLVGFLLMYLAQWGNPSSKTRLR